MSEGAATASGRPDAPLPMIVGYALVVGVIGGIGAWLFRAMIAVVHNAAFLGRLGASYDATLHTPLGPWGAGIIVVPAIGAIGVVFLVEHFAPEAKGHGVPEVMDAIYNGTGVIRPIVVAIKASASALTIGTGGSVGREGPIVQIGAAAGSTLGQVLNLSKRDLDLLIATGAAAGIAATFNSPLGGLLFTIELLLVAMSPRSLLTVAAGVLAAIAVARALIGSAFAFSIIGLAQANPISTSWTDAIALAAMGVMVGGAAAAFTSGLYWFEDRAEAGVANPYLRHAMGMTLLGAGFYAMSRWLGFYSIQGLGYATVTDILDGKRTGVLVLLVLFVAKALATMLTLGSGGSGGIFSPSMMMGASLGGAIGYALDIAGLPVSPAMFVLAGMAGMVAATTGATITAIVMLTELSGDYGAILPLLITAVTASAIRHSLSPVTIYTEKLRRRGHPVPSWMERRVDDINI